MPSKINAQQCACIVKELLSPQEQRRIWADQLLFSLDVSGKLDKETCIESQNHLVDKAHFIPALISYWSLISHTAFKKRMSGCKGSFSRSSKFNPASSSPYDIFYPIEIPCKSAMTFDISLGINTWLEGSIGAENHAIIPQLLASLNYNDCEVSVIEILGNMGEKAKEALPVLINHIKTRETKYSPANYCEMIAKIIGQDNEYLECMASELESKVQNPKVLGCWGFAAFLIIYKSLHRH